MPRGTSAFPALGADASDPTSPWGGWRLQTNWTMTPPVPCGSLRTGVTKVREPYSNPPFKS